VISSKIENDYNTIGRTTKPLHTTLLAGVSSALQHNIFLGFNFHFWEAIDSLNVVFSAHATSNLQY
jgi:hypothetical protein